MRSRLQPLNSSPGRLTRLVFSTVLAITLVAPLALHVAAADPGTSVGASPSAPVAGPPGLVLEAQALLGGNVRPGAWTAVRVHVRNDGPSISGELRIRSPLQGASVYGTQVELPSTSDQEHLLYAQPPLFGTRLNVDLVSTGATIATREVVIRSHDANAPIYAIVAERPEGLQPNVAEAARNPEGQPPRVITLRLEDLPPRVQAWSAIDRLIWQDVDAGRLSPDQREALQLWVGAGGHLIVVGGTTGVGPVRGFPEELLPFTPIETVDAAPDDLSDLLGPLPADAAAVPALGGTLRSGAVWARSGDDVIAAQIAVGHGSVALVGINPAEQWIAAGSAGDTLWRRLMPVGSGPLINPLSIADDSTLIGLLNNLPSVDLPPIEQLFLLLFAYVALIGPVNYVVLRRLDRREWAWITMPALVGIFAVVSYGMGASLKGSDVIVNEVAIVRAGEGTDRGLAQVYVGVFSPTRRTFDVRIPGGALLANPSTPNRIGQSEVPLDVLFGETARLRNFEVGFGVLRGFRAEASTTAPLIETDLRLSRGRLAGTVTNRSDQALENVAVTYAGAVAVLDGLAAGETRDVNLDTSTSGGFGLSERIFGTSFPPNEAQARVIFTRRSVIDQLTGHGQTVFGNSAGSPLLLGWRSGSVLDVELAGERPNRVGDSLYVVPLSVTLDRETAFNDQMLIKTVVENSSGEGFQEGQSFYFGRGTMTIETRPGSLSGGFSVSSLELALTEGEVGNLRGTGTPVAPLPDEQQPDQEDPVGPPTGGGPDFEGGLPELQLWDHAAGAWYEFPTFVSSRSYLVSEPDRFVDGSGRVLTRLVNRGQPGNQKYFTLLVRLEGTVE